MGNYHLIDMFISVGLIDDVSFYYVNLTKESCAFHLALTINPVLEAIKLTKCACHPKIGFIGL